MKIEIPGYKELDLNYLVLDYNGTIAMGGEIKESVKERICRLAQEFEIVVLTADTYGTRSGNRFPACFHQPELSSDKM